MSEKVYLASISGGKDSTAMALHLREQGIEYRAIHFDVGWEHPETMRYVREVLPEYLGPIEIHTPETPELPPEREDMAREVEGLLGFRSAFVRLTLAQAMFPKQFARWCTRLLKIAPLKKITSELHAERKLPVNVVGIRAAESRARAKMPEHELSTTLDCMVWRPLIRWRIADVVAIHKRHGVPPNPLYLRGADRVGCWPCIMANKNDLRMLDEPRIRAMEVLEDMVGKLATERREAKGESLDGWHRPRFYQSVRPTEDGKYPPAPIRDLIAWSKTARGGREIDRQMSIPGFNSGCLRWGMCDVGGSGNE